MKQISKSKTAYPLESNENFRTISYFVALGAVFSLVGILTIPEAHSESQTITIGDGDGCEKGICLSTNQLIITAGSTVTWENKDEMIHTVISGSPDSGSNGQYSSGMMLPGDEFSFTFQTEGLHHFYCDAHPWMRGVILVA